MFSTESTCYPHKNKFSGKRYNYKPKTFNYTHTLAHTNWNQKITVACSQRSDSFYMLHGTLSYSRQMRYEFLIRCDFEIFVALRLFVDCSEICSPVVACSQRSDSFYMLHGTLSYSRQMRYEWGSTLSFGWKRIWDWLEFVYFYEENTENFGLRESWCQVV